MHREVKAKKENPINKSIKKIKNQETGCISMSKKSEGEEGVDEKGRPVLTSKKSR
jgi:hypothetical protein